MVLNLKTDYYMFLSQQMLIMDCTLFDYDTVYFQAVIGTEILFTNPDEHGILARCGIDLCIDIMINTWY